MHVFFAKVTGTDFLWICVFTICLSLLLFCLRKRKSFGFTRAPRKTPSVSGTDLNRHGGVVSTAVNVNVSVCGCDRCATDCLRDSKCSSTGMFGSPQRCGMKSCHSVPENARIMPPQQVASIQEPTVVETPWPTACK